MDKRYKFPDLENPYHKATGSGHVKIIRIDSDIYDIIDTYLLTYWPEYKTLPGESRITKFAEDILIEAIINHDEEWYRRNALEGTY